MKCPSDLKKAKDAAIKNKNSWKTLQISFFKLVFTPCNAEQPQQGMGLQIYKKKKHKKVKTYVKSL